MLTKRIYLYEDRQDVWLDVYVAQTLHFERDQRKRAMLVVPGGGYWFCSDREAEPIARAFMGHDMNAFVLQYSIAEKAKFPQPLLDASKAMAIIREHAEEFHINPDQITACGFSAGGHLAASLATLWHLPVITETLGIPFGANRPNGVILSYPVITAGPFANVGSIQALAGSENVTEEQAALFSLEQHVDERTAPAFIWHTANDPVVPIENSLLLGMAYAKAKVPFEMHIFPDGPHGLSLATEEVSDIQKAFPHCAQWVDLAVKWLNEALYQ